MAEAHSVLASYIEAPDDRSLPDLLYPKIHQLLRRLSGSESAKSMTYSALRALRGFASAFRIKVGDVSIYVDPEPGVADSGHLESDLLELCTLVGKAAKSAGTAWVILLDEVQYLSKDELSALIVALHRTNQLSLPIVFFGAGLPQLAALSGNAESYAERLFDFSTIGPLDAVAASRAIKQPFAAEDECIEEDAVEKIIKKTHGYPYFLQEWGYQSWNAV